jgi:hypothetical protein
MDFGRVLDELRKERDALDQAIRSLERLENSRPRGPGRPRIFPSNGHSNGTKHARSSQGLAKGSEGREIAKEMA